MADLASFLLGDFGPVSARSDADYDRALGGFVRDCRKLPTQKLSQLVEGNNILQLLDPARNSISYLFVLLARLETLNKQDVPDEILFAITAFLTSFDPVQARYAGLEWRRLVQSVDGIIEQTRNYQLLPPIRTAILRMDPSSSTFTTNHLLFVQICLEAASPRQALPILDKDIYALPSDPTKNIDEQYPCSDHDLSCAYITVSSGISGVIKAPEVQEYYLLGAQIYTGLRQFERARLFLELVLAVPSQNHAVSPYMVEAYKKLRLVGLLAQGKAYGATHLTDQPSLKTIQNLAKPYDGLVTAFENRDLQKFYAEVDIGAVHWTEDGNTGIVNQAVEALRRYRVIDLQSTYAALAVDRVAIYLSLSANAAMDLLTTMIRDGYLNATISAPKRAPANVPTNGSTPSSSPILRFHPQTSNQTDAEVDNLIREQVRKVEELSAYVKEADRKLAVTREWADYVRKSKKADIGAAAFEDPMEIYTDMPGGNEDEDIMAM